jgi:predicted GIY-YIG superfamily endonuclease
VAKDPTKSWGRSGANVPTCTYRFFDAAGYLLYVGVTDNLEGRTKGHRKASWWPKAARTEVVWFENRLDALYEESRAIDTESPIHNRREGISPIGVSLVRVRNWRSGRLVPIANPTLAATRYDKDKALREVRDRAAHATVSYEGMPRGFLVPWAWYERACQALGQPTVSAGMHYAEWGDI